MCAHEDHGGVKAFSRRHPPYSHDEFVILVFFKFLDAVHSCSRSHHVLGVKKIIKLSRNGGVRLNIYR